MARNERFNVDLTANDQASPTLDDVAGKIEALPESANVELGATDDATETVEDVGEGVENLDGSSADVDLSATDDASEPVEEVTEGVENLDGSSADVDLAATDSASDDIADVTDALGDLDGESAAPEITIEGDTADEVTEVSDALGDLDSESATASMEVSGADEVDSNLSSIMGNLDSLGKGAIAGLAAGALTSVFSSAADHVLDVRAIADATGDTLRDASALVEQFDFVGGSTSQLLTMIGRANDAFKDSPELAGKLGITISENQSPLDTFVQTIDALNSGQLTATERLSIATDIFGRRGLKTVLELGTQVGDISDAMENIPEWQVVTDSDVRDAIEFKQTMDDIQDLAGEAAQQFLTKFGPAIAQSFRIANDLGEVIGGMKTPTDTLFTFIDGLADEQFSAVTQALEDMGGSVESLFLNYLHLNEVTALLDLGIPPEVIATADMTNEAYEKLATTMADTEETAAAVTRALDDNAVSAEEWARITGDGVITMQEVEDAVNDVETSLEDEAAAVDESAAAHAAAVAKVDEHVAALESERDMLQETIDKLDEKNEAIEEGGDSYINLRESQIKAEEALDDYHAAMLPVEDDTRTAAQVNRDQERALLRVVSAYDDAAEAAVNEARRTREATGASFSNADALRVRNDALLASARTMDGPEREAILRHIARINGIPEYRITQILTDADPDDIAQVEREVNHVAREREARVNASARRLTTVEEQLAWLTRNREAYITVYQTVRTIGNLFGGQHGSSHTPATEMIVGETGPEIVRLPAGSQILTHERSKEELRSSRRGGPSVVVYESNTIHNPPGTPTSHAKLTRRYQRRNGLAVTV